jgi:hypothetical protein
VQITADDDGTNSGLENLNFFNSSQRNDLVRVLQWGGSTTWNPTTMFRAFRDCTQLDFENAARTNLPDTSAITNWQEAFYFCSSISGTFPTFNTTAATTFSGTWRNCSGLTAFPFIASDNVTNFTSAWESCSSLTSFPLINTAAGTNFTSAWINCSSLTSFPLINTAAGTNFLGAWNGCSSLTSFPLINTAAGTTFGNAWINCSSLTSFPLINTAAGTTFSFAWQGCASLTSFPALNFNAAVGTVSNVGFQNAWANCTQLADFPPNLFDNTIATRFLSAFENCALTAASIENIIVSINTANTSNGNLSLQGGTNAGATNWTAPAITAYDALIARGWTITRNA